jgi:hypothetical protein
MSLFCCASNWAEDIFPSSIGCGEPFCWANDITAAARQTCENLKPKPAITFDSPNACCDANSAMDGYIDPTTGSR